MNAGDEYKLEVYPFPPQTAYQAMIRNGSTKLFNHVARALSPIQMSRVRLLSEGQDARDLPPELAPKKHYSGAYGRLYWDKPARTITRWVFIRIRAGFFIQPKIGQLQSVKLQDCTLTQITFTSGNIH